MTGRINDRPFPEIAWFWGTVAPMTMLTSAVTDDLALTDDHADLPGSLVRNHFAIRMCVPTLSSLHARVVVTIRAMAAH